MRSIRKVLGASWAAFRYFAVRQPRVTAFAFLAAVILLAMALDAGWQEARRLTLNPGQLQAEEQKDAQHAVQEHAEDEAQRKSLEAKAEEKRALCRLKSICKQYGQVRQECATAGSFQTCVRVKMGDENADMIESCTSDGHIAYTPSEPGAVDCFFSKLP
jgi:hypothetical protein